MIKRDEHKSERGVDATDHACPATGNRRALDPLAAALFELVRDAVRSELAELRAELSSAPPEYQLKDRLEQPPFSFVQKRTKTQRLWVGIGLRAEAPDEPGEGDLS